MLLCVQEINWFENVCRFFLIETVKRLCRLHSYPYFQDKIKPAFRKISFPKLSLKRMDEILEKIAQLKRSQELMIAQQDLTLEVTPRDSRFSTNLLELMRKEETMLRESFTPATKLLIQKVDDALRQETQQFFAKVVNQNNKKWDTLRTNLTKEIQLLKKQLAQRLQSDDRLIKQIQTAVNSNNKSNNNNNKRIDMISSNPMYYYYLRNPDQWPNHFPIPKTLTTEELLLQQEEERLRVDYYINWYRYEMLHLQEAFRSQVNRIDRDWQQHEKTIEQEFTIRREKILGPSTITSNTTANTSTTATTVSEPIITSGGGKFHHPEKQKTLIHTAPVFQPNTTLSTTTTATTTSAITSSSGKKSKGSSSSSNNNNNNNNELQRIEREYQEACTQLSKQKTEAKRWLYRQQLRLVAQCEEIRREKIMIADVYKQHYQEFDTLTKVFVTMK
jgi:hypothetical protein